MTAPYPRNAYVIQSSLLITVTCLRVPFFLTILSQPHGFYSIFSSLSVKVILRGCNYFKLFSVITSVNSICCNKCYSNRFCQHLNARINILILRQAQMYVCRKENFEELSLKKGRLFSEGIPEGEGFQFCKSRSHHGRNLKP